MRERGWQQLDIIFVSGDAYIDHPAFGVPLLAHWLEKFGFKVGIIAQPDWRSKLPFMSLGRPKLFFAVSAGAMDSMVAHYTPARKLRHDDAYTPGNKHGARPNRATIIYTSRIKEAYKDVPVVIGGIEASLRRFAHYDFWENKLRRSILFDSKADLLVYGMAETALLEVAKDMQSGRNISDITSVRGTAYISKTLPSGEYECINSFEEVTASKEKYAEAFKSAYLQQNPWSAIVSVQGCGNRQLVCNPPAWPLSQQEMDSIYALPFEKSPHPSYKETIPAWEQIKTSITSHRGCFGGCAFCAITMHQGKTVQSRSRNSITSEVKKLVGKSWFRGSISDIGGPTANMFGLGCGNEAAAKKCQRESCIFPSICKSLITDDKEAVSLLAAVRQLNGVRHSAVSSGVRYDLMKHQPEYMEELVAHHVSGLLKVAPEHLVDKVTNVMRKPGKKAFEEFVSCFAIESSKAGKKQYLVPYLISGHPGCTLSDMYELAVQLKKMNMKVEQVQDFTPTPGTVATCMFYSGIDPMSGEKVYTATTDREKGLQKSLLLWHLPTERAKVCEALKELGLAGENELIGNIKANNPVGRVAAAHGIKKAR